MLKNKRTGKKKSKFLEIESETIISDTLPLIVADRLRSMVSGGSLAAGTRLRQVELAEQFGISRVPVREALKLLSAEGMVVYDPQRGFFVGTLSSKEAAQLFRMRQLIENEVMESLRWPTDEEMANLQRWVKQFEKTVKTNNQFGWWITHRDFIRHFFNLSPQDLFVAEAMRLWDVTARYYSVVPINLRPKGEEIIRSLHTMLEAMCRHDRISMKHHREFRIHELEVIIMQELLRKGF